MLLNKADEFPEFQPFANMKKGNEKGFERWHGTLKAYRGPVLRVWETQVEGPIVEQWPPSGHEKLYGKLTAESLPKHHQSKIAMVCQSRFSSSATEG